VRIAGAIELLVVLASDYGDLAEGGYVAEDFGA